MSPLRFVPAFRFRFGRGPHALCRRQILVELRLRAGASEEGFGWNQASLLAASAVGGRVDGVRSECGSLFSYKLFAFFGNWTEGEKRRVRWESSSEGTPESAVAPERSGPSGPNTESAKCTTDFTPRSEIRTTQKCATDGRLRASEGST
jgi:hypothetical protein